MPPRDPGRRRVAPAPAPATAVGRPRRPATGARPAKTAPADKTPPAAIRPPARREATHQGRWRLLWGSGRLAALVLAIGCAGALVYLLTARDLTVRDFRVSGVALVGQEEIVAGTGVVGHNIFTFEPQGVAERLATLPTVRRAVVWGELPDRLIVRVDERQPLLIWQVGGDRFVLDEEGTVLLANPPAGRVPGDLPTVAVRDVEPPQPGARVDRAVVLALLTIARGAPENGLPLAGVDYSPRDGYTLRLDGDRRIVLGPDTRLPEKLAAAAAIAATNAAWTALNVTDPDRPFFPAR